MQDVVPHLAAPSIPSSNETINISLFPSSKPEIKLNTYRFKIHNFSNSQEFKAK